MKLKAVEDILGGADSWKNVDQTDGEEFSLLSRVFWGKCGVMLLFNVLTFSFSYSEMRQ